MKVELNIKQRLEWLKKRILINPHEEEYLSFQLKDIAQDTVDQVVNNFALDNVSCCFIVTDGKTNIEVFNNEESAIKLMKEHHKLNTPQSKQVHYIKKDILN